MAELGSSPYINHFIQPDTIIPDLANPQDWNRYGYVRYNPLKYVDPSGHNPECGPDGMYCNIHIQRPDKSCIEDCRDAYLTYKALVKQLGYVPTIGEILYMTAFAEYSSRTDRRGVREFGQEGLARNYYEQCDIDGCQGNELYNFLSAYEPWSDWKGVENNKRTPSQRADHLAAGLDNNVSWLWDDVSEILDIATAKKLGWTKGKWTGEPWQWFGPFTPGKACTKNVTPYISIDTGNGTFFWMLFAEEDANFGKYCP